MESRPRFQPTPYGQYLLLERIGSGGMAEIFRAKTFGAAGFEKEYAIKRILPNLGADQEFVEMFVNEAKLVVDLYHANIVQVFDLGDVDGSYFIAMEFVHGKDLLDVLARCTEHDLKIPLKLTLYIAMEMLKGLDFAHNARNRMGEPLGIIHRDVSPSNIMLSYGGNVKVGDFGVAKAKTQTHLTEVGTLKGKVGYMSPEQVRGEDIDHRSDVFAAGIILYEALTMTRLFMGGNDLDVMLKIRDSDIEDDLRRCRKVPPGLVEILRKALCKDGDVRFQSCAEFHGAIQNFSYAHDIKATSTDLSTFLHRVFAEEIRAEKKLRLADTGMPRPLKVEPHPQIARAQEAADRAASVVRAPVLAETIDAPPSGPVGGVGTGYRYRAVDGAVKGPMTLGSLKALLSRTEENSDEAVSIAEGAWRAIDDLPELWSVERNDGVFKGSKTEQNPVPPKADATEEHPAASTTNADTDNLFFSHAGALGKVSFARLLFRLQRRRCDGMLRVVAGEMVKQFFFRRGQPIAATSTNMEERLGSYLVNRRIITEAQLQRGLDRLAEFGGRLGDALVGERVLPTHDLFQYLTEQLQDRIRDVFTWAQADWAWFPDVEPTNPPTSLGLDIIDLVVESVRQTLPPERVREHFEGREANLLEILHSRLVTDDLPLVGEELDVAGVVTAGKSPAAILSELEGGVRAEPTFWRTLYYLTEFELYRLGGGAQDGTLPG